MKESGGGPGKPSAWVQSLDLTQQIVKDVQQVVLEPRQQIYSAGSSAVTYSPLVHPRAAKPVYFVFSQCYLQREKGIWPDPDDRSYESKSASVHYYGPKALEQSTFRPTPTTAFRELV